MMNDESTSIDIVLLGCYGVGKSCMALRFMNNTFDEKYNPTIENKYTKAYVYDQQKYSLKILDAAGVDEFYTASDNWIKHAECYI